MMPIHHRKRAEAGFTLLELLIAITIFALIMVALSEGVHFSGRAWRSWESHSGQQGDVDAVQTVLRQMIVYGKDFGGDRQSLKFVGKLPAALARGGVFDITLSCDGDSLTLSWVPHFKGTGSGMAQQQNVTILDGVVTAVFAYHFETRGWQGLTSGQTKPLQLVALQARLANGRIWTPFVVAPVMATSAKPKT
jgi:general secretion pathway protein J